MFDFVMMLSAAASAAAPSLGGPAEIWGHIKSRESLVANSLELDLGNLEVDGKTVQSVHAELNQFLDRTC